MNTNSLLERQTIRLICFILGGLVALSAVQLFIVNTFTTYSFWFSMGNLSPFAINIFLAAQFFCGMYLVIGKIFHKYRVIVWSLKFMWLFHFIIVVINAVMFKMQSSSFIPYLMIGLIALVLWGYYKNRDDHIENDKELLL